MNSKEDNHPNINAADSVARKRALAKRLIPLFFRQLTEGCGDKNCTNNACASSGRPPTLSKDEAAAEAIRLFVTHATLCKGILSKAEKALVDTNSPIEGTSDFLSLQTQRDSLKLNDNLQVQNEEAKLTDDTISNNQAYPNPSSGSSDAMDKNSYLNEDFLNKLIARCLEEDSYLSLSSTIFRVFSNFDLLKLSFHQTPDNVPSSFFIPKENLTKEDIRAMEIDQDKDEDSKEFLSPIKESKPLKLDEVSLDIDSVQRIFSSLFLLPGNKFQNALINSIIMLFQHLEINLRYNKSLQNDPDLVNVFLIILEIPMLDCPEYLEAALPAYCKAFVLLPLPAQAKLARVWSKYQPDKLKQKVDILHHLITLRVITGRFTREYSLNDEEIIVSSTKVMKILYAATVYGGTMDSDEVLDDAVISDDSFSEYFHEAAGMESKEPKQVKEDSLFQELGISILKCRKPVLPFEDFYNEPLSDQIEMDRDFSFYKTDAGKFSFMNHAFILTPAVKALGLYYDNRITMYSERRMSVLQSFVHGDPPNPYLRLRVRRDHLIDDALVGLEVAAMENPTNLKKQLVVEFEDEQGIDEGGISKEFFQLIVEDLFNPDFAMFVLNPETQNYWFNPTSFESDAQFTLVGIILGLAIYNNVILDVHFSMVVYKKLLGKKGMYYDLADWNPSLARGLEQLLNYKEDDIEEVFMQTFQISYQDIFGTVLNYDLKEGADKIVVNKDNRQEFVELYADFLLNKSVERQFRAFRRGFQMVTDDSPLKVLFRPEEIELLVCGSQNFDFAALEDSTEYDGGYSSDSFIIKSFWELVHSFSLEQKRKLLQFATGSDRAPVGGLAKLKLVIARSGPDSDRLPTAHTCFNVLLLPEYLDKDKLQERLLKAINYSKGFGML